LAQNHIRYKKKEYPNRMKNIRKTITKPLFSRSARRGLQYLTPLTAIILIGAMTGTGYAVSQITGAQIKDHSIEVRDLSRNAQRTLKGNRGLPGLQGPRGFTGSQGPMGVPGVDGKPLMGRGSWNMMTMYQMNDVVEHDGSGYVALVMNSGITPGSNAAVWMLMVSKGDAGLMGPQGLMGLQGPVGMTGPMGPMGMMGPMGPMGPMGMMGPMGPMGPMGLQGEQGEQGPAGADGNDGLTGPMGPQGEQGEQGPAGADGNDGLTGPMGPQGEQGEQGPAGADGNDGLTGPMGPPGIPGPIGPQGPAGPGLSSIVTATNSATSSSNASSGTELVVDVDCGLGTMMTGGGGRVDSSGGTTQDVKGVMLESYPLDGDTWRVRGILTQNLTANTTVTVHAYARCAS
jgi:hypothetical protein